MKSLIPHRKVSGIIFALLTFSLWAIASSADAAISTIVNPCGQTCSYSELIAVLPDFSKSLAGAKEQYAAVEDTIGIQKALDQVNEAINTAADNPQWVAAGNAALNNALQTLARVNTRTERAVPTTIVQMQRDADIITNPNSTPEQIDAAQRRIAYAQGQIAQADARANNKPIKTCSLLNFTFTECIWYPLVAAVGSALISITALLLTLAGTLFNWLIDHTIILYKESVFKSVEPGINVGWAVFRDLANIGIIGMFVFMAIMTILGSQDYGYKKLLANILIIAILLNFSLLFTKMIIDASNFTASEIYALTQQRSLNEVQTLAAKREVGVKNPNLGDTALVGIAEQFVNYLGVAGLGDTYKALNTAGTVTGSGWVVLLHALLAVVMLGGAALVLFYGAYILIYRAIAFLFLMLTSSIAFGTHLHPKLSEGKYGPFGWDAWWKCLLGNAVLAPLLVVFLYVNLMIAAGINKVWGNQGSLGSLASGQLPDTIGLGALFNYVIILGILYASFAIVGGIAKTSCSQCWTVFSTYIGPERAWRMTKGVGEGIGTGVKKLFKGEKKGKEPTAPATATQAAGTPRAQAPVQYQASAANRLGRAMQGIGRPGAAPTAANLPPAPARQAAAAQRPQAMAATRTAAPAQQQAVQRPQAQQQVVQHPTSQIQQQAQPAPQAQPGTVASTTGTGAGAAQIQAQNVAISQAQQQAVEQAAAQMAKAGREMSATITDTQETMKRFGQAIRSHAQTVEAHAERIGQAAMPTGGTGDLQEIKGTLGQIREKLHEGNATMRSLVGAVAAVATSNTSAGNAMRLRFKRGG